MRGVDQDCQKQLTCMRNLKATQGVVQKIRKEKNGWSRQQRSKHKVDMQCVSADGYNLT